MIDGESVALDERGTSNFSKMQDAVASNKGEAIIFYAFDLLELNGADLRTEPLIERKRLLAGLLADHQAGTWIQYADHVIGNGPTFYQSACDHGLEGVVSKQAKAPYRSGRSRSWLKVKCAKQQEFVVGGWQPRSDDPADIGSLLVGFYRNGLFEFAGKVGTGFDGRTRARLLQELKPYTRSLDPFVETPREIRKSAYWVDPNLVVQVRFTEFTSDGLLRQAVFQGERLDKEAADVKLEIERPTPGRGVIAESRNRWRRRKS